MSKSVSNVENSKECPHVMANPQVVEHLPSASLLKGEPAAWDRVPWWTTSGPLVCDPYMCPALEIWIDKCPSPTAIRLSGILDGSTEGTFLRLMDDLLAEGVRHLIIDAAAVEIGDPSGAEALMKFLRRTREAGGSLTWEGVDFKPRHRVPMVLPLARNRADTDPSTY
jgi:anti-anti-sigma regulatory factor